MLSVSEAILVVDGDGVVLADNGPSRRFPGIPVGADLVTALGERFDLFAEGGAALTPMAWLDGAFLADAGPSVTRFVSRASGQSHWLTARAAPATGDAGDPLWVVSCRDVSDAVRGEDERRRLEQRLVVADRLAAMGTVSAGVAHEVNNALSWVLANLAMALEETNDPARQIPERVREAVVDARDGAARALEIAREINSFARGGDETRQTLAIDRVVESALRVSRSLVLSRARLVKSYDEVPPVLGHEGRLGQVVLNLLINAAQAIPEGSSPEAHEVRVRTSCVNGRVVVDVTDTGVGIPAADLPRVFEPFFTSKPPGVGTGLGLPISRSIVRAHGGDMEIESEPGGGTTVRLWLPAFTTVTAPAPATEAPLRVRVLVVDDEPRVGATIRRALDGFCDSELVMSPVEALERLAAGRYDVVLCDVLMPGMTGFELHDRLLERDAEHASRFLFLTGGSSSPDLAARLETMWYRTLEKPFDIDELRRRVKKIAGR